MLRRLTIASVVLVSRVALGWDIHEVVLPAEVTCEDAWGAESAIGSKGWYEGPYDLMKSLVFNRKHGEDDATVFYACQGGIGPIAIRNIIMQFNEKGAAFAAFERHRSSITQQLGNPCWDPTALSLDQQLLMGDALPSELGLYEHRNEWNALRGFNLSLTLTEPRQAGRKWSIAISQVELASSSRSWADSLTKKLYEMSSCEKESTAASPNKSPERTRGK